MEKVKIMDLPITITSSEQLDIIAMRVFDIFENKYLSGVKVYPSEEAALIFLTASAQSILRYFPGFTLGHLRGGSRKTEFIELRCIFNKLVLDYAGKHITYAMLGRFLNKNHATIYNSISQAKSLLKSSYDFKTKIKEIEEAYHYDMKFKFSLTGPRIKPI